MTDITAAEMCTLISARAKERIRGSVRLDMPDLAVFYVDATGAIVSEQDAEITLTAKAQVFYDIATGKQNPAAAFMTRKLKVDGNPMRALKIGEILSTDGSD